MNDTTQEDQFWSLWKIGLIAAAISAVANLILLFVTKPFMDVPDSLMPMTPGPVVIWSVIGALGAIAVYALVRKFSATVYKTFKTIAVVVLVISFIPDIALINVAEGPFGGATWGVIIVLMTMHVISFAIIMPLLRKYAR